MSSVYAREPEPESGFWEHEDIPTSSDNHHQRRTALEYVMDLAARSVDPDDHEDERLARREQLDRIVELAARYAPPQPPPNDNDNDNDNSERSLADAERLEARSALGMALRPFAKELGNVIKQVIANKMHRREQADDGEFDARDLHDEVHDELVARSAFGMAFRPIAQELGRAFRTAVLEQVKKREVEDLEMRSAFGMAFRPIAQELGRAFRTAILEKVKREIDGREEADGALESREDVADAVESALQS